VIPGEGDISINARENPANMTSFPMGRMGYKGVKERIRISSVGKISRNENKISIEIPLI